MFNGTFGRVIISKCVTRSETKKGGYHRPCQIMKMQFYLVIRPSFSSIFSASHLDIGSCLTYTSQKLVSELIYVHHHAGIVILDILDPSQIIRVIDT